MAVLGGRLDNGSNSQAVQQLDKPNVGSSYFDLSMVHTTTVEPGALVPVDLLKVILGDSLDLSCALYIDMSNPLVKPLLSRVRAYVHYYYQRCTDQWKGYQNFITTGRRASAALAVPNVALDQTYVKRSSLISGFDDSIVFDTPMALPAYFGFPWGTWNGALADGYTLDNVNDFVAPYGNFPQQYRFRSYSYDDSDKAAQFKHTYNFFSNSSLVSALPFVMYQSIYRDYYLNKNLSQNNKNWFPDSEDDFILPYDTTQAYSVMNNTAYRGRYEIVPNNSTDESQWDDTCLMALRYRQWRGDYFTEALPWQYRGDEPYLGGSSWSDVGLKNSADGDVSPLTAATSGSTADVALRTNVGNRSGTLVAPSWSANQIRELFTLATFRERLAKTNGDYNQMMASQFGISPKIHDRKPIYIGGCKVDLNASVVEQTSESSDKSALGTTAGRMSAVVRANIGHFQVPDNGYVMAVLSIVPDVVYSQQGIPREMRGGTSMQEEYFPLFNNLAPQGIMASEIVADDNDDVLFGWCDRYLHLKTRRNRVSGLIDLPAGADRYYSGRVWTRRFTTVPVLGNAFVTCAPPSVERDLFTSPLDPAFVVQFASMVGAVRRMPFKTRPASLNGYAM